MTLSRYEAEKVYLTDIRVEIKDADFEKLLGFNKEVKEFYDKYFGTKDEALENKILSETPLSVRAAALTGFLWNDFKNANEGDYGTLNIIAHFKIQYENDIKKGEQSAISPDSFFVYAYLTNPAYKKKYDNKLISAKNAIFVLLKIMQEGEKVILTKNEHESLIHPDLMEFIGKDQKKFLRAFIALSESLKNNVRESTPSILTSLMREPGMELKSAPVHVSTDIQTAVESKTKSYVSEDCRTCELAKDGSKDSVVTFKM